MENLTQFIPILVLFAISVVPAIRLLRRTGKSRWWAILLIFPVFGAIILLWLLAFTRWRSLPAGPREVAAVFD